MTEGQFIWSDGKKSTYRPWRDDQPDNAGEDGEDCVDFLWDATQVGWNDESCDRKLPFICKVRP